MDQIDQIYIINLDTRPDRWEKIVTQMEDNGITEYRRFPAVCPSSVEEILPEHYAHLEASHSEALKKNPRYIKGSVGCKASHIEILKDAKRKNYQTILILEDDAYFRSGGIQVIKAGLEQAQQLDWKMLYVSANHLGGERLVLPNVKQVFRSYATLGYFMKSSLYDEVIENALNSGLEIDVYYATQIHPQGQSYCLHPHPVGALTDFSDIQGQVVNYQKL